MNDTSSTFNRLRPRLRGIAYRMLGSTAEAEEVVQDARLRWHESAPAALDSAEAWLPWTQLAPKAYQAMAAVSAAVAKSGIGMPLIKLLQTRVSQINGCAFCLDMHVRDLRKQGETWQRINSLSTWREVSFYTPAERAALVAVGMGQPPSSQALE